MQCGDCANGTAPPFPFTMAFQPIVNLRNQTVHAYEALVRGPAGESAHSMLARVTLENVYAFDQSCRICAIETATALGLAATGASLSINFMPNAVYRPETCIRATLAAAAAQAMPLDKLIFEVTEGEQVSDSEHLTGILAEYRRNRLRSALDDFGAGYAGLTLLAAFQPDILKIDMALVHGIETRPVAQKIVAALVELCNELGIEVIAEGIETREELEVLTGMGVNLLQGFIFARPGFRSLPKPVF